MIKMSSFDKVSYETGSQFMSPSYNEIGWACGSLVEMWKELDFQFQLVVGISRGGLIPGVIISHLLQLPLEVVCYSSKDGAGDNKNHENQLPVLTASPMLIIDDISDTGKTLMEVRDYYTKHNVSVYTAALYYKVNPTPELFVPDFRWRRIPHDAGWVTFPWEKA